jgi:hypothetical protein
VLCFQGRIPNQAPALGAGRTVTMTHERGPPHRGGRDDDGEVNLVEAARRDREKFLQQTQAATQQAHEAHQHQVQTQHQAQIQSQQTAAHRAAEQAAQLEAQRKAQIEAMKQAQRQHQHPPLQHQSSPVYEGRSQGGAEGSSSSLSPRQVPPQQPHLEEKWTRAPRSAER